MRTLIACSLLTLALTGCASTAKAPAGESAAAKQFDQVPEGKGVVYLYRLKRAVGAALATQVKVKGLDAGGLGPGDFFKFELTPGKYSFAASSTESSATAVVKVVAGKSYFLELNLRMGLQKGGRVFIKPVSPAEGRKKVKGYSLVTNAYIDE